MLLVADLSVGPRFCFQSLSEGVDGATKSILLVSVGGGDVNMNLLIMTEDEKGATFSFLSMSDSTAGVTIGFLVISYLLVDTKKWIVVTA